MGFNPQGKNNGFSKPFSTIAEKQSIENSKQLVVSFFCMRKGHFDRLCKVRNVLVPRGILKWVPKNGPKFKKGPSLFLLIFVTCKSS